MSLAARLPVANFRSTNSSFRGPSPAVLARRACMSKSTRLRSTVQIKAYKVTFQTPDGEVSCECDGDTYMLDAADEAELDMPYSCRAGSCSTCLGKIVSGEVDQSEGTFLDEDQQSQGWVLTCISYPKGDVTIASHKEGEV